MVLPLPPHRADAVSWVAVSGSGASARMDSKTLVELLGDDFPTFVLAPLAT